MTLKVIFTAIALACIIQAVNCVPGLKYRGSKKGGSITPPKGTEAGNDGTETVTGNNCPQSNNDTNIAPGNNGSVTAPGNDGTENGDCTYGGQGIVAYLNTIIEVFLEALEEAKKTQAEYNVE